MEIRDVLHGSITVRPEELLVVDSLAFQRLRQIKQLGFAENSFPSATHNRYIHSLGAMHTASRAFVQIASAFSGANANHSKFDRFHSLVRLAALLHDVGHGPLSHTTEFAMPLARKLAIPHCPHPGDRKATHEDYTLKIILDSDLTPAIEKIGRPFGYNARHVAALIDPEIDLAPGDTFFQETLNRPNNSPGESVRAGDSGSETLDFRPLLKQLISSELDADRMDYLRRDSLHAGVSYGQFDFDWLVTNLTFHVQNRKVYLALQHRALYSFEDFLLSRFHMFLMVYFHYKSVVFDEMLGRYLNSPESDYELPSSIENYMQCNDAHLYSHLAQSKNPWAKRISERRPYRMLIELHSGIPNTPTALMSQDRLLSEIERDLLSTGVDYLLSTSTSELSKYFRRPGDPIFVRYDNLHSEPSFIHLEQCTDLFEKYQEKRSITRLYVPPESYGELRSRGRSQQLRIAD